jgi:hypothetical protein
VAHVVYFLGAGAARSAGFLTTPELFNIFTKDKSSLKLFSNYRHAMFSSNLSGSPDIETLYTMVMRPAEVQLNEFLKDPAARTFVRRFFLDLLLQDPTNRNNLNAAFDECREAIVEFIRDQFWNLTPDLRPYSSLRIPQAIKRHGPGNVAVYTTNYDLSLETYLEQENVEFNRGQRGEIYDRTLLITPPFAKLRLLKLHGSIDFYMSDGGQVVVVNSFRSTGPWKAGRRITGFYLVPPIEGKQDYHPDESKLLTQFATDVGVADYLIIIGSSLRDPAIVSALQEAPAKCEILFACGIRSSELQPKLFPTRAGITVSGSHFPHSDISKWLDDRM